MNMDMYISIGYTMRLRLINVVATIPSELYNQLLQCYGYVNL